MASPYPWLSPIFDRAVIQNRVRGGGLASPAALNQVARDQAAAQAAVRSYAQKQAAAQSASQAKPTRMAGIFSRLKPAAPYVAPGLIAADAAIQLAGGKSPERVAVDLGRDTALSQLGAAIGTVFGGPPGAVVGGIAAPVVFNAAVGPMAEVDMRYITPADVEQMRGKTTFGGLSTPYFEQPQGIPEATATWLQTMATQPKIPAREVADNQPQRETTPPSSTRPVEERHSPVTAPVTPEVTQSPEQRERQAGNELAQLYAKQYRLGSAMAEGGELQRRLYEGGASKGMPVESFMSWVEANPALAYRLAEKRGLLPEPV